MYAFLQTWGALIVAGVALVQPWVTTIWRRLFGCVDIYESGQIEIGFSNLGPTVGLIGTLRARGRDIFVRRMRVEVVKTKDHSKHAFEWCAFRSAKMIVGGPQEFSLPHGFMLTRVHPYPYSVAFSDAEVRAEIQAKLQGVYTEWSQGVHARLEEAKPEHASFMSLGSQEDRVAADYYREFLRKPTHVEAYTKIDRTCYWEPGLYTLTLLIESPRPERQFRHEWTLELSDSDCQRLRLNALKILQDTCGQTGFANYSFAYVPYSEHNQR